MIHSAHSDSDNADHDSDSPLPPHTEFKTTKTITKPNYKSSFKTKLLNLKNKNIMQRFLLVTSTALTSFSEKSPYNYTTRTRR